MKTITLALFLLIGSWHALAQCPITEIASDLRGPLGITQTKAGNLLVAETGTPTANTGRISILDTSGNRRTLVDGLPSGISAEGNEPSGPTGLFLLDRTLYVAIGVGDAVQNGSSPGIEVPNPNPSSPLLSSVLAIHFSVNVEKATQGFVLTPANQQTLASHQPVILSNIAGEQITIELVCNFPNYTSEPQPGAPDAVRNSNPFALVAVGNKLYVTDGGQNEVYRVDLTSGSFSVLATFPPVANPLPFGPPVVDAVPTGITYSDGQLLVTLFRGFPFAAGTSTVEKIDPQSGGQSPFISGLKTAIKALAIKADEDATNVTRYLVLEHASGDMLSGPGRLLRFDTSSSTPIVLADCLAAPSSMTLDGKTGTLYINELNGKIATIAVAAEPQDANAGVSPSLLNTSTRGLVQTGDDVMIAGFIAGDGTGNGSSRVLLRAIGPSLASHGLSNVVQDPMLELHDASGSVIASNDNWKDTQQTDIQATGLAPTNDLESAILSTLPSGAYTAIIRGKNNGVGIGLVEIYNLTN